MSLGRSSLLCWILFLFSCGKLVVEYDPPNPSDQSNQDPVWTEKVIERLRYGQPLRGDEDWNAWLSLSREEVLESLMKTPEFGNTVLDFNLYFLGHRPDSLFFQTRLGLTIYQPEIYAFPQAIRSAQETLRDGNFLSLLELNQPWYVSQNVSYPLNPKDPTEVSRPADRRARGVKELEKKVDELIKKVKELPPDGNRQAICLEAPFAQPYVQMLFAFMSDSIGEPAFYWPDHESDYCRRNGTPENFINGLQRDLDRGLRLFARSAQFDDEVYQTRYPTDVKDVPLAEFKMSDSGLRYPLSFWRRFANSSTNMNRKRAAYFLSTYFCDDLTPVQVENPALHMRDKHASDPGCYACHYKLDPMAGFFRYRGFFGLDFSKDAMMFFDDGASAKVEHYTSQWKTPEGKWNIGYVRSTTDSNQNEFGESEDDLFKMIGRSPEVKSCLVKKMARYFVGEGQMFDSGYLAHLTSQFVRESEANSAVAFKNTVKRLLLSQAFLQQDPLPNVCYDYAPGVNPTDRPPCEVAFLLEKNCASCHGKSSKAGGLDLTSWKDVGDGTFNFDHLKKGKQLELRVTAQRIVDRLSSLDPDRRMPLGQFIRTDERDALYLWANRQASGGRVP